MSKLVEVASFYDPEEAYCARGYLQAQGIDAFLQNEHHLNAAPPMRIALGGYRLLVHAELKEAAERALDKIEPPPPASPRKVNWSWIPFAFLSGTPFLPKPRKDLIGIIQFSILILAYASVLFMGCYTIWRLI